MRRMLLAGCLVLVPVFGDGIITDWRGMSASAVVSAVCTGSVQCTEITTTETHGLATGDHIGVIGGTGSWVLINTQQGSMYVKQAWDKAATSVIVSDTTRMEPTAGASWTVTGQTGAGNIAAGCDNASYPDGTETVTMTSVTDGRTAVFARGSPAYNHCPEDQIVGPINRNDGHGAVLVSWPVTVIDGTHYTIPLNSSALGSFTGTLVITHGSSTGSQILVPYTGDGDPNVLNISTNHTAQWIIDACNTATPLYCANTYSDPMNQFGYGSFASADATHLVVSGGTATFTFLAGITNSGVTGPQYPLAAGTVVWLWGWTEPADMPWGTLNRLWVITGVTGTGGAGTQIQIGGMGAAGIPDGTYTPYKTSNQLYIPMSGEEYFYFESGATDNNYPFEWPTTLVETNGDPTNPLWNRQRFWWQPGANFKTQLVVSDFVRDSLGTYGLKGYHALNLDWFANQWMFYEITTWPDHAESATDPWIPPGADSIFNGSAGYQSQESTYGLVHWFQGGRIWYMNITSLAGVIPPQTGLLGPLTYAQTTGEPEEWTSDRAGTYDGTNYHIYVRAPAVQRNGAQVKFNFYYSAASAAGDLSGSTLAASNVAAVSTYNGYSTSQAQAVIPLPLLPTRSFQIQPIMNIAGVSGIGQSPVVLSFLSDPNLSTSSLVTTTGIGGNTAANVTGVTPSAIYPRQFLYRMIPKSPAPTVAGPLPSITVQSGGSYPTCSQATCTCTANLTVNTSTLNVFVGSVIGISGVPVGGPGTIPPGAGNTQGLNFYTVANVASTSFDFSCPTPVGRNALTPGTYNTDYNSSTPMVVVIQPAIAVPPNGTPGAWDGGFNGTLISQNSFAEIIMTLPGTVSVSPCDLNGDGTVNVQDVVVMVNRVLAQATCSTGICGATDLQTEVLVDLGALACPAGGP